MVVPRSVFNPSPSSRSPTTFFGVPSVPTIRDGDTFGDVCDNCPFTCEYAGCSSTRAAFPSHVAVAQFPSVLRDSV